MNKDCDFITTYSASYPDGSATKTRLCKTHGTMHLLIKFRGEQHYAEAILDKERAQEIAYALMKTINMDAKVGEFGKVMKDAEG